jgi:hypothetical protein
MGITRRYQYSETNVMHLLLNLLRIKDLITFRALLAHPQEALHKPHVVYFVCVISVGCTKIGVEHFNPGAANRHNTNAIYKVSFA